MNYGYFDVENKEYVITRPDTPTPWLNYLGSGKFSGIISNNAGGLLFDSDPGNRRLTRYKYNSLPMDRPGYYLYIRDTKTGEYWSPTWQPVLKNLDFYECRHGLGYTTIKSAYNGIETEITYYIPKDKNYTIWNGKIKNTSNEEKALKLFSYMEFSYHSAMVDITAEWARYVIASEFKNNTVIIDPSAQDCPTGPIYGFMSTDLDVSGHDTSRETFIGAYRSEQNPVAVENGECFNTTISADQLCAALECPVTLSAGEEKEFIFTVGTAVAKEDISSLVEQALDKMAAKQDLDDIKKEWNVYLSNCQIKTPDEDVNKMINIWHAYQCKMTFDWSRFISYYERGVERGWGFRDSMQDVLGLCTQYLRKQRKR